MKPVSSCHITVLLWIFATLLAAAIAAPAPSENLAKNERADSKIDDLRDKIQKLQVLLEQYAKAKATNNNQNSGSESGSASAPAVDKARVIKEPVSSSHSTHDSAGETIAKLISQLDRKDVWILKKFVETLERLDNERSQGVYQDKPVPESEEGVPKSMKDKVARVLQENSQFYKSQIEYSPESRLAKKQKDPVHTEKGSQLSAVERKLIEDLNEAVKQGYTVEDIINDLENRKSAKLEHERRRTQEERELAALLERAGGKNE